MRGLFQFALGFGFVMLINYTIWDIPARATVRRAGRVQ